ncbi:MAG: peptidoglycan-binding protein [Desulfobacula sp.]|uniref:peptidoglycan-binding domain-containing protein n=1 Tax=Desulfobacula sp. TaxID=2593537 RepID=UPI0025C4C090|nr:peptidoglycan-binding domain-containing protein [Desulfobacula sp.]MCD4719783.1 peptidoglycan-binding protein [Desulfobacula sp.]
MFRKIPFWIGLLILSLFVCGCVSTTSTTSTEPVKPVQEEGLVVSLPDRTFGDMTQQPAHVKLVMAAMVNKLRGSRDTISEVAFDSNGKHAFYDPDFTYGEFDLAAIQVTGFIVKEQTDNQAQLIIEGMFNFVDLFGRGSATYFAADYTVRKNGITINNSGTALIAPGFPDIETYYVPKSSFDGVNMKELTSFMDLYLHAALNAFKMEPTQEERKNKEAYEKMSVWKKMTAGDKVKAEEYYIMAFCKDRLPPETSLEMKVTDKPKMKGKTLFETGYVYDQGWRAMIAGGTFSPDALKNNFHVSLQYNPDPGSKSESICVGGYTNQKNYHDTPKYIIKQKPESKTTSIAQPVPKPKPKPKPIESGVIFLDPRNKGDARLIQTRLKDLGYYNKKIDGDFGRGSKKALKNFRNDNGLEDNSTWDLSTQKILFENSGL